MTIQLRELHIRLSNLQRCAEKAPDGTYDVAKRAALAIEDSIESVRSIFRGYGFKVDNTDRCRDLEAAIYGYLLASNRESYGLTTGEGFGEHVDGPAGERVIAQAIRDRDSLARRGVVG